MLGAVAGDADRIGFLKRIGADQRGRHLPGDHHQRDRIHPRIGDPGNCIGRAGAGRDQRHARLASGAGVTFCCVDRSGLVANQNVADVPRPPGIAEQLIIDRQHRAAGIAEHEFDPLFDQALHQNGRAAEWGGLR